MKRNSFLSPKCGEINQCRNVRQLTGSIRALFLKLSATTPPSCQLAASDERFFNERFTYTLAKMLATKTVTLAKKNNSYLETVAKTNNNGHGESLGEKQTGTVMANKNNRHVISAEKNNYAYVNIGAKK